MAANQTAKKTVAPAKKTATRKPAAKKVVRKPAVKQAEELTSPNINTSAYVPDPHVAKSYVGRKVFGVFDKIIADAAMAGAENILLQGDTGAGKTLFGEAYASHQGLNYYSLPCDVSIDPSALFGRMQPTSEQGVFEWVDGPVTTIVRSGGILNISEVNFMPPKIAASLYPLLDGRRYIPLLGHRGEVVRAHIGTEVTDKTGVAVPCWCDFSDEECNKRRVLIIADMNPMYRGTMELNAAFKNRWDMILPWGYDREVEERLVQSPTLRAVVHQLRAMVGTELITPISTNMMMEFEKFAKHPVLGLEFAIQNFNASFEQDEQQAVFKVLDLNRKKFESDMRYINKKNRVGVANAASDDDLEEIDFEYEEVQ